ncbi:MAG: hypothetical protein IVW52_05160 [Acidimicrobiales bacterium]|nr:hypothetical protein [Acidimicrobiales bacterium]
MSAIDHLRRIREEAEAYRAESLCGTCREDGLAVRDWAERSAEFETLMREYVAAGLRHPHAGEVSTRSRQVAEARDEVARRLGGAPGPAPARGRDGLLLYRPGDAAGVARSWRQELSGVVPRPFGILPGPARRRP